MYAAKFYKSDRLLDGSYSPDYNRVVRKLQFLNNFHKSVLIKRGTIAAMRLG